MSEKTAECERLLERLAALAEQRRGALGQTPETEWLALAATRLGEAAARARSELERGIQLPELEPLRAARKASAEQSWLGALCKLSEDLAREAGATSPLIEALFPHQRFQKLEKNGAARKAYRAEFALRRKSSYVRRLEADPGYTFLPRLLAELDRLAIELGDNAPEPLDDDTANALRDAIGEAGTSLGRTAQQARLLCEAALIDEPELFASLKFDERRRRPTRVASG